jgi:hypothetical protein
MTEHFRLLQLQGPKAPAACYMVVPMFSPESIDLRRALLSIGHYISSYVGEIQTLVFSPLSLCLRGTLCTRDDLGISNEQVIIDYLIK